MSEEQVAVLDKETQELNEAVEQALKVNLSFTVDTKQLTAIIQKAHRSTAKVSTVPVLKGIYFSASSEGLVLRAQNNNYGTEFKLESADTIFEFTGGDEGAFVILDPDFQKVLSKLPTKQTVVTVKNGIAEFKAGKAKFDIPVLEAEQFPRFPHLEEAVTVMLPAGQLKRMYGQTAFACSGTQKLPIITGVNHSISSNGLLKLVGTDGHRLSQVVYEIEEYTQGEINLTVPKESIDEVIKLLGDNDNVVVCFTETQVFFVFDNTTLFALTLVGNYPDVARMIPQQFSTEVSFRVSELHDTIDRAVIAEKESGLIMKYKPEARQSRFLASEAQRKGFQEDLLILKGEGEDLQIKSNGKYILELLKTYNPGAIVKIQFLGNAKPFVFRIENGDDRDIQLVLPIQNRKPVKEVVIDNFTADLQLSMDSVYMDAADALALDLEN